jgi:YesN/AraC family two-component response regulator
MGTLYNSGLFRKKEKNVNKDFFIKVSEYVHAHYGEELHLPTLAKTFGYSENYFSALFNKTAGTNLNEYINGVRIRKVMEMRKAWEKKYTLKEIAQITGYNLNTVKSRLYAGLKKLKNIVGEDVQ